MKNFLSRRTRLIFLLSFTQIHILLAQDRVDLERPTETLTIQKTSGEIVFDGVLDEPAWDRLTNIPLSMYRPHHGNEPTEDSEIFVTFDDEYFYLGARMWYTHGGVMRATTKKRDGAVGGNDNFGILLDTFNDNENALCFETNPSGLRSDFTIANDAQVILGARPFNRSWNAFWDVKMKVIGQVWHVEMQIPLSTLRFQDVDGKVMMGMTIWRQVASKQEWNIFPLISNELGPFSIWKPSQARKIVLEDIKRTNPVYITPYALAGLEQSNELSVSDNEYQLKNEHKLNAGLDIKYALTSNLTMDLTLNTDFAQVEADDQVVNLTRFSVFFPEKRQFFVERSSIFTIRTGYEDQLFYSRRIGLHEGEIIPIIGGARLVGRVGKWDLGVMDLQTASREVMDNDTDSVIHLPTTNHGVLRARKQVINRTSYAGGMITSRIDAEGNYNLNTALDLLYNPFRNDYVNINYVRTFDNEFAPSLNIPDHGKFFFNWQNRSNVGLTYDLILTRAGKYYEPEMGFERLEDYSRTYALLGYGWVFNEEEKKMLTQQLTFWAWVNKRNQDFITDYSTYFLGYDFSLKTGFSANANLYYYHEYLVDPFDLYDDATFPPGYYDYFNIEGGISTPSNKLIRLSANFNAGSYYDGFLYAFGPLDITARFSSVFNIGLDYQYSQVDVPERDLYFNAHLARLRTELTFTTKLSLFAFIQYSSGEKFGVNNVRFRYNPREGHDLYLVYNGSYNTHLYREIPHLPAVDRNTLLLKYTYTFVWE